MSRLIQQPVASVKLTNVATVRLTKKGKRFEVACYKNKIMDYRAGLETDLSEVLQTSNMHIFTNVAKGQFASEADLEEAFDAGMTQEEIAIEILLKGKSLQVSEAERAQKHESTLTQIATWIATNCIHSGTGKPYTASQIKHALTLTNSAAHPSSKHKKKRGKNTKNKDDSTATTFSVQPHKPIKQQYLQALKYLQSNQILAIQRAAMELQWQYPVASELEVISALERLELAPQMQQQQTVLLSEVDGDDDTKVCTVIVDPSFYRPLQEAVDAVPGSRLEIMRQQVFHAVAAGTAAVTKQEESDHDSEDEEAPPKATIQDEVSASSNADNDDDDDLVVAPKNLRKANKKQQKKAQRRVQQQHEAEESPLDIVSEDDEPPNKPLETVTVTSVAPAVVAPVAKAAWTCNTCAGGAFDTQAEYRAHFRSDWHRYNQKLKLQKASPISLQEFQQCDAESFFATHLDS